MPNITPKIMLTNQLKKAIKIVWFNLFITVIMVSLSILGLNAEIKNSWNKLTPPKCKLIISWYPRGIKTKIGRKDIDV